VKQTQRQQNSHENRRIHLMAR